MAIVSEDSVLVSLSCILNERKFNLFRNSEFAERRSLDLSANGLISSCGYPYFLLRNYAASFIIIGSHS